jgi:hypothetical protein
MVVVDFSSPAGIVIEDNVNMSTQQMEQRAATLANIFGCCVMLLLAIVFLSNDVTPVKAAFALFIWAGALWQLSPNGPKVVVVLIPGSLVIYYAHTLFDLPLASGVTLLAVLFFIGHRRLRSVRGILWNGLSSALASIAVGLLAAAMIAVFIYYFGVPAAITAQFQNGIVEICFLLESVLKPQALILLSTLALGLSFLVEYPVVKNLGKLVASLTLASRAFTVLSCLAFVAEPSAEDKIEKSIDHLSLEYKDAEEKIDDAKARYLSAAYLNEWVQDAPQRNQLATKIQIFYQAAKPDRTY